MFLAAEPAQWYQVGAFWVSIIAVIVSLAVGGAGGWIASRNVQKRKLLYGTEDSAPLLKEKRSGITVLADDKPVDDPYLVSFVVESRSRQDITDAHFRNGRGLQIVSESDILSILEVSTYPKERVFPSPRHIDSRTLELGPGVISKRQLIRIEILTDGDPKLTCRGELIDVQVEPIREPALARFEPAFLAIAGGTPLGGLTVSLARLALRVGRAAPKLD